MISQHPTKFRNCQVLNYALDTVLITSINGKMYFQDNSRNMPVAGENKLFLIVSKKQEINFININLYSEPPSTICFIKEDNAEDTK